ncbi:methyltransferase domain-containing protein [bacterium]|jgi:SAM-dependent methyltransferase|nr:methyltransferase domain-containing protein [bacterium]
MNLKETYNQIAEDWHRDHKEDDWWREGVDKFISLLGNGKTVLDVGCGSGLKSKYLINRGLQITGIDFSEKMIEIAKREIPTGEFLVLDLNEVYKINKLFDGIFMHAVLLHLPKKQIIEKLVKLGEKLSNEGYLYLAVKEKRPQDQEEEIVIENDYGYSYERFFSYFTIEEIEYYLNKAEFKVVFLKVSSFGSTKRIQVIGQKLNLKK